MEDNKPREAWIEPTIETLEIEETNALLGAGGDGNAAFPDCTKS